jgi:hypothetical protein
MTTVFKSGLHKAWFVRRWSFGGQEWWTGDGWTTDLEKARKFEGVSDAYEAVRRIPQADIKCRKVLYEQPTDWFILRWHSSPMIYTKGGGWEWVSGGGNWYEAACRFKSKHRAANRAHKINQSRTFGIRDGPPLVAASYEEVQALRVLYAVQG